MATACSPLIRKRSMAVPSGAHSAEPDPRATSLHPPQRSKPVDVPRQDQDVGLGNRALGSWRRRWALLPGVPQPEQGHPVALLQSHGAHRLANGAGGRLRGNDQVPTIQLQIVDGPRVMSHRGATHATETR